MTRLLLALTCLVSASAFAQDGQIDASYGADGFVGGLPQARPIRLADLDVTASDEAVYVGWSGRTETQAFVGRVTAEGTPDVLFGTNGLVELAVGGTAETLRAVVATSEGTIYAAGVSDEDADGETELLTAGVSADGGSSTVHSTDLGEASRGEGIAIWSSVPYVGVTLLRSQRCAVGRLTPSGALDPSFGTDGLVVIPTDGPCETADVAATATGIALVGTLSEGTGAVLAAQITPEGLLDASFGTDGLVARGFDSSRNKASSLAIGPDGDLIIGGLSRKGSVAGPLLVRFDRTGAPLDSFGYQGLYWTADAPSDGLYAEPPGVVALSDGRVAFATTTAPTVRLTVGGITSDGEKDLSFGANGFTTATEAVSNFSYGRAIALDSQGRLIVGGEAIVDGTLHQLVISRLTGSPASTSSESDAVIETGSLQIAPNPTVGPTRITTTLTQPATVQAVVLDSLGRQLATLHDGPVRAGEFDLAWDASAAAPGLYVVRMLVDGRPILRTMTVAR